MGIAHDYGNFSGASKAIFSLAVSKNRRLMIACGYFCYYLEHCSNTNQIAIKGVM